MVSLMGILIPACLRGWGVVTAMQAECFYWPRMSSGVVIQLCEQEKSFLCVLAVSLLEGSASVTVALPLWAEGTKCSWGLQKWLKRPSCWSVCLGAVLHAMKVVLSLFQYRIISLNFGLLINFGDLPQFGWVKGECLSKVYEFLKLSDKRNIIVW